MSEQRHLSLGIFFTVVLLRSAAQLCSAATFTDVTVAAGVNYTHWQAAFPDEDNPLYMTGGAAAGDYDGDGWVDLYVTRQDNTDILYRNLGNGNFQDVSTSAGFNQSLRTNGATWGDVDNDGDADLYVTTLLDSSRRYYLYINNGNGAFTEQAVARGADLSSPTYLHGFSSTFGDYDRDGYLDLFTVEWNPISGSGNTRLLRNLGEANPGEFEDVTTPAGVDVSVGSSHPLNLGFAFAPTFADMDRDGHSDLVIAGDFGESRLYWNNGDGTFTNGTTSAGVGTDENGMGSAIGDYDGDGDLDWFVSSIYESASSCTGGACGWSASGNRLYLNNGNRTFTDATDTAGVRDGGWGWGSEFLDYDNDGDLDLTHTNGIDFPNSTIEAPFVNDQTRFWENSNGTFSEVATQVGIIDDDSGKGLLTFDYDNDGDLDIFVVNNSGQPVLYRNDGGNTNDWLKIKTVGTDSNADGIGAQITVIPDGTVPTDFIYQEVKAGSNFLGQSDITAHFGLGDFSGTIDQVIIEWPATGIIQVLVDVAPNAILTITEPELADWSHDGTVDALDLAIWSTGYGTNSGAAHTDGDANNNGVVDGHDFLIWQRQHDNNGTLATVSTIVPEPSGFILMLMNCLVLVRRSYPY